jgi:hypothetical protein
MTATSQSQRPPPWQARSTRGRTQHTVAVMRLALDVPGTRPDGHQANSTSPRAPFAIRRSREMPAVAEAKPANQKGPWARREVRSARRTEARLRLRHHSWDHRSDLSNGVCQIVGCSRTCRDRSSWHIESSLAEARLERPIAPTGNPAAPSIPRTPTAGHQPKPSPGRARNDPKAARCHLVPHP